MSQMCTYIYLISSMNFIVVDIYTIAIFFLPFSRLFCVLYNFARGNIIYNKVKHTSWLAMGGSEFFFFVV